jgi:hypothetical protein
MSGECRGVALIQSGSPARAAGRIPFAITMCGLIIIPAGLIDLVCRASRPKARGDEYRVPGTDFIQTMGGYLLLTGIRCVLLGERSFFTEERIPIIPRLGVCIGRNQK